MPDPLLHLKGLDAHYGDFQALYGIDMALAEGEVIAIIGANGAGKTTLMRSICGLLRNGAGQVVYRGQGIGALRADQVAGLGIALVPEGRQVFPTLTVMENLLATARNGRDGLDEVFDLFPRLAERKGSFGSLLSGGEQQMLAIGRALLTQPRFLILDEATEGLAPAVRREIWGALKRLKDRNLTILVIDKNVSDLTRIADQHFIVEKGRTVWSGNSTALRADASISTRYLGL